jgi:hypothetical protein
MFKPASIADGVNEGYWQYLMDMDLDSGNSVSRDAEAVIGAPPFGPGLKLWLERSPEFNLDKIGTPLEIVAISSFCIPYAGLRYLHRLVDLLIIDSHEHVFTNPADWLISQGDTLDWIRFWLKGEEDPDPAKAEQYARWRKLRELQEQGDPKPK